jgi:CIC family chloride channel protein
MLGGGLIFIKIIATSITIGAGGNGGIFAPSLFIGAMTGFVFAHLINLLGIVELTESNFIVAAMAGALSGVVHAPLTAIFLIAEITGGYALFVPLMIVSSLSFLIARYFEPYSVYSRKLAEKGLHKNDEERKMLNRIVLADVIETDLVELKPGDTLGSLVQKIETSRRTVFPVLSDDHKLLGIITLDNIREIMFDRDKYDSVTVSGLMTLPQCTLDISDEVFDAMKKFDYFDEWYLPVTREGRYLGFVSKSVIFNEYRNHLKAVSD